MGGLTVAGLIKANWQEFLVAGTYTWNYGHFLHIDGTFRYAADGQWYLGHTWSLALEEQFYWAWPALFIFIARRQCKRLLGCIILIVPLIRMASYVLEPYVRDQLHVMFHTGIDTILVGCFLAMHRAAIERRLHRFSTSPRFLSTLIGVVFLVIPVIEAKLGGYWLATYGATIEASLIALLILGIMTQPNHRFCQLLRCRPCMFMGVISYSLYLWQQLFCATDSPVYMPYPLSIPTLRVPIAILGSIGAACLSYYVIEKPFLKLKHRKHVAPPKALRPSSDMG
jgi:peptidoglycan/LPS O-acetylase OafA/YrhL